MRARNKETHQPSACVLSDKTTNQIFFNHKNMSGLYFISLGAYGFSVIDNRINNISN